MTSIDASTPPIVRLRHHLKLYTVDGEGAFLVSERGVTVLEGEIAIALAKRLDGSLTPDEIVSDLSDRFPEERLRRALDSLVNSGFAVIEHCRQDQALGGEAALYEMSGV